MLMLCFEWWVFEILSIFSGSLGVYPLAAEVIIVYLISLNFMLPIGISFGASALTGNYVS
jgi:Na+-driven multidrug efflux pump